MQAVTAADTTNTDASVIQDILEMVFGLARDVSFGIVQASYLLP